jgi:alkylation response protein AidB-like acyl-CoA dehydrogenase
MVSAMTDSDLDAFARSVRDFFDSTLPTVLDGVVGDVRRARVYRAALFDAGLAGLDYPRSFGGQELGAEYLEIFAEESKGKVPSENSIFGIGVGMALPTVRDHCTEPVKERFLAKGLRGEEIWCQLYSEPGAGSDLASLSTKAIRDGDEWVVTGQKVWTSGAQHSDVAILLVRTDPDAPKHRGVTMLIMPMKQPGVTVRPLRQMTGDAEFNEVFFDEARVPADWVVGEINDGWRAAVALLAHERIQTGVASMSNSGTERLWSRVPIPVVQLIELARQHDRLGDPLVRQELAQLWINERIVGFLRERSADPTTAVSPSIGKLWRTIQGRAGNELAARLQFSMSPAWVDGDEDSEFFAFQFLNCRGMSMGGGTDEIQKNTLGERVLGLPREPQVDKNTPFNEILKGV